MSASSHLSKDFFDLVKSIGESRSKQEEDKIILREVATLKTKMAEKDVPSKKMKEYLIRMIYVEMLGHDASFGHISAVKMVHEKKLLEKRVGYLAVTLTLHADHSFILLLINSIQGDLKSENYLEVSMALTAVCKLVSAETVPALRELTVNLLEHKQANVRKKAVMALHRFHQIDPDTIASLTDKIRRVLCDKDPAVMAASLNLFLDLVRKKPAAYKDLVPSFVSILKQVTEHRLPRDYDYHRIPAPWVQLRLLQILAVLGANDKQTSEGMYEILHEVMKRADIGINVGYAIVYECVRTVISIYPDTALLDDASLAISRFITADNHNLKYLGVNSLAGIVLINPKYAAEHQLTVIDCLEDPDETLKRKTLDLLYSMTNPANVTVIVDKLTTFLRATTDEYLRSELVSRINQLAEKFAPNNAWYITTMNTLFELGGELVRPEMGHALMRLLAEAGASTVPASGQVGDTEIDIRTYAVETYITLLKRGQLPDTLLQVISWVLGEFGHLSSTTDRAGIIRLLGTLMDRHHDDPTTRSWTLAAILKLVAHMAAPPSEVKDLVGKYQSSLFVDLQQRAHEFMELAKTPRTLNAVMPLDAVNEDIKVDAELGFLDGYVDAALRSGAKPYTARVVDEKKDDDKESVTGARSGLRFAAYATPAANEDPTAPSFGSETSLIDVTPSTGGGSAAASTTLSLDVSRVRQRWGPDGYNDDQPKEVSAAAAASTVATTPSITGFGSSSIASGAATVASPTASSTVGGHLNGTFSSTPGGLSGSGSWSAGPLSGGPSVDAPPRPKREPVLTAEQEKKKADALALFAGIGGASSTPASAAKRATPVATTPAPVTRPTPVAAPTPVAVAAPAKVAAPFDIFGSFAGAFESPPVVTPTPAPYVPTPVTPVSVAVVPISSPAKRSATIDPFGDMFGPAFGGGIATNTSVPSLTPSYTSPVAVAPPVASPVAVHDPFAFMNNAPATPSVMPSLSIYGADGMSPVMKARLQSFPKMPATDVVIGNDERLHISYQKCYATDRTIVCVFISNKQSVPLPNLTLQVAAPAGFTINFDGEPAPQARAMGTGYVIGFPTISSNATCTLLIGLQASSSLAVSTPDIRAQAVIQGAPVLPFTIPLFAGDVLRPLNLNTQQYGTYWKQLANEMKVTVRPAGAMIRNSVDFMARARDINLFAVQTIGQENITAARLLSTASQPVVVLLHARVGAVSPVGIDFIVHSSAPELSAAVIRHAAIAFAA